MPSNTARPSGGGADARADDSRQLDLEHDAIDPRLTNLPAQIDQVKRQIDEAHDLAVVRELKDRAEALRVYCKKHGGLVEAHNRRRCASSLSASCSG
jgi:hypothetical protein